MQISRYVVYSSVYVRLCEFPLRHSHDKIEKMQSLPTSLAMAPVNLTATASSMGSPAPLTPRSPASGKRDHHKGCLGTGDVEPRLLPTPTMCSP